MRLIVTGSDGGGAGVVTETAFEVPPGATVLHRLDAAGHVQDTVAGGEVLPAPGGTSLVTLVLAGSGRGSRILMHATPTVDYGVVLRGSAWLEMENGDEVLLQPGDVLVQDRTQHAWRNDGPEPCVLLFSMRRAPDDTRRSSAMSEGNRMLEGRTCIVSGVGPGVGAAVARLCAREGGRVVLAARSTGYLGDLEQEMKAAGAEALAVATDVRVADDCERLVDLAGSTFGSVDVLVNNAALTDASYAPVAEANLADWRRQFEVNLFGSLQLSQRAVERMVAQGGGSIVFVNSMIIRKLKSNQGGYAASKAALLAASQALAREVGPHKIRVNSVLPGWIWGPGVRRYADEQARRRGVDVEAVYQELARQTALRLLPTPEDIAEAIVFLASDRARAITGQTLDVNAGEVFA